MTWTDRLLIRIRRYNPRPARARARAATGLDLDALSLPGEDPARWRALLDAWLDGYPTDAIAERARVERAALADIEARRYQAARHATLAEAVRTAELGFEHRQEDEVEAAREMLHDRPAAALARFRRSAAGNRYLIGRWERLAAILEAEGTWYGHDRDEATRLQGARPEPERLAESEAAYLTRLYCLLAQPEPKDDQVRALGDPALMPEAFQDRDPALWMPVHPHCRILLGKLVEHELGPLRAREDWLRTEVEGPARAAARERAWLLAAGDPALLRLGRHVEQAFDHALRGLPRGRMAPAAAPAAPPPAGPALPPPRPAPGAGRPPQVGGAFLDYHASRRAVLDEDWSAATGRARDEHRAHGGRP